LDFRDPNGCGCFPLLPTKTFSPAISLGELEERFDQDKQEEVSAYSYNFYNKHVGDNLYLEMREKNISNPEGKKGGGWGVFAKTDIPSKTVICPYLGELFEASWKKKGNHSAYAMVIDGGVFLDAVNVKYDVGYFLYVPQAEDSRDFYDVPRPSPPNYGRYINSINMTDVEQSSNFVYNARFEIDPDAHDAIWLVSTELIRQGTEVLVSYNDKWVPPEVQKEAEC